MRSIFLKLNLRTSPLWVIFEINFLRHLSQAVLTSILPIYFRQFVDSDAAVGLIFLVGYTSAFVSNIYSGSIIRHLKKRRALLLALIALSLIFALFAFVNHSGFIFLLFAFYQFILALFILDISLYIKHYSNFRILGENIGKNGSLSNIGWVIGPLLGGLIAEKFGFEAVFLFSSIIATIALITFFFVHLSHEDIDMPHTQPFTVNVRRFFNDANLRRTYINNAGLGFVYSIWDFLPLLMLKIGATIPIIAMTKTLMGIPQAIFEFPIGRMADSETGERRIFILGYILAFTFTALLGLTTNLHIFITFFFIAATGTSFLEMTRDSYFFRQMPEREIELISVYRTSDTIPYLFGQGFAILTLSFLPIGWWFVIGGCIGILFVYNAHRLKEIK